MEQSSLFQKFFRSKLFFGLEIFLSIILGITLVLPIMGSLLILNEIARYIFKVYLRICYKDKMKLYDDQCGSNYLCMTTKGEGRHTILYLGEVEGKLDVTVLRNNYQKHVIENRIYENLKYNLHKKWFYTCLEKCEDFDIKNHIRYYPGTEERIVEEDELLKGILPDLSEDMEEGRPQWEEVIIPFYRRSEDKDKDNCVTVSLRIIRIHHSYFDGASTLLMIANTFSGEGASFPYVIDPCKPLKISKVNLIIYKIMCLALFASTMIRIFLPPPLFRKSRFLIDWKKPGKRLFGWTGKIPMEYFQNIKEKSGVSMPAIVSTALSAALRDLEVRYPLRRKKWEVEGGGLLWRRSLKASKCPETHPIWIVAGIFPYEKDKPRNKHIGVEVHMNTSDVECCERLGIMSDELGRLAKNPMVTIYYWFAKISGRCPRLICEALIGLAACPVLLSNIPLSTRNVKLWGKECYSIMGWVPLLAKTGLGVVTVRYGDHFRYNVQVDSSCVNQEELDYFVRQIEEEVEKLFLETAQLKRKISTEASCFDHGKDKEEILLQKSEDVADYEIRDDISVSGGDEDRAVARNNNNGFLKDRRFSVEGAFNSANYSFIFKLKDSIENIREGIRKIKEQ